MRAVTVAEMRAAEQQACVEGWSEEALLRMAGRRLGLAIGRLFPQHRCAVGYLGKGHNAGDVAVALRVLREEFGWRVGIRIPYPRADWRPLLVRVVDELGACRIWEGEPDPRDEAEPMLVLDGLVGAGVRGGLRGPLHEAAAEIRRLRERWGVPVVAVDVPSGVDPETGKGSPDAVVADLTLMIGNAKEGLLRSVAVNSVGALGLVPVEPLEVQGTGLLSLIAPQTLDVGLPLRPFEIHKGQCGRVVFLAGSRMYPGAAVLCATAALRAGAGLVHLHVPMDALEWVVPRCPPEVIVRGVTTAIEVLDSQPDALVIGCGLDSWGGSELEDCLLGLAQDVDVPIVFDADALNRLSGRLNSCRWRARHVWTPHPGEFRRLAPDLADLSREDAVLELVDRHRCTVVLKGARSLVAGHQQPLLCNSTGHPGMATGGQGDWLAGMIGALLARGLEPRAAAALGVWLAGRSAERAVWQGGHSAESLLPSDLGDWVGSALGDWRGCYR